MSDKRHKKHPTSPNDQPADSSGQQSGDDSGMDIARNQDEPREEQPVEVMMVAKEEFLSLKEQLEQTRQQAQEYSDGWQRERADFANYKRRNDREQEQRQLLFSGNFIKKILPVIDDLERALKVRPQQGDGAVWSEGIELIYRKMLYILDQEGVQPIPQDIQDFDPTLHEAISHEDHPDHASGEIIEVVQQGYKIGDRVLRPALVRVAR